MLDTGLPFFCVAENTFAVVDRIVKFILWFREILLIQNVVLVHLGLWNESLGEMVREMVERNIHFFKQIIDGVNYVRVSTYPYLLRAFLVLITEIQHFLHLLLQFLLQLLEFQVQLTVDHAVLL